VPAGAAIHALDPLTPVAVIELLRARFALILCEGGPSLLGQLIDEELLDELFLTRSPKLFGRLTADGRKPLIDGVDLSSSRPLELASVRRHRSHLFLRYLLGSRSC
jgi:5-amino-6-(5-phosphoribosylamino)uracil reductase